MYHTKRIDDEHKGGSHIIYDATGEGTLVIWRKKKAPKGSTRKTNRKLLEWLIGWIDNGYFDKKRTALEIYKKASAESGITFRIGELEKCIKILCGSRSNRMDKEPIDGILMYWRKKESPHYPRVVNP